jgi:curved DNA-binding protein CbpA
MREPWETEWKDYYEILQVHFAAEEEVIEAAFRRLTRKYHPDVSKLDDSRMKRIIEANGVLSDQEKRARYDAEYQARSSFVARERAARAEAEKARREAQEARERERRAREEFDAKMKAAAGRDRAAEAGPGPAEPRQAEGSPTPPKDGKAALIDALAGFAANVLTRFLERSAARQQSQLETPSQVQLQTQSQAPVHIGGHWRGDDGLVYVIQQSGAVVVIRAVNPLGIVTAESQGTISGRTIEQSFRALDGSAGTATFEVSPDGRRISGRAINMFTGLAYFLTLSR